MLQFTFLYRNWSITYLNKELPVFTMLKKHAEYAVPKHIEYVFTKHRLCCHVSTVHGPVSDWASHVLGKQKREMFCLMVVSVAKIIWRVLWMNKIWWWTIDEMQGKPEILGEKPVPVHFAPHKSHMGLPGTEPRCSWLETSTWVPKPWHFLENTLKCWWMNLEMCFHACLSRLMVWQWM